MWLNTAPSKRCDGVPNVYPDCCTSSDPCGIGEGVCASDAECLGSLKCGHENCRRDFSSSGSNWTSTDNCCEHSGGNLSIISFVVCFEFRECSTNID